MQINKLMQLTEKEIQEAEKKPKQYTAFGVTGGIGAMIGVFVTMLIIRPQFWRDLYDFIQYLKNHLGG